MLQINIDTNMPLYVLKVVLIVSMLFLKIEKKLLLLYEEKLFERIDHYLKDIFEIKDLAKNHLKMIKVYEIKDSAKNIKFDKNGDYVFAQ